MDVAACEAEGVCLVDATWPLLRGERVDIILEADTRDDLLVVARVLVIVKLDQVGREAADKDNQRRHQRWDDEQQADAEERQRCHVPPHRAVIPGIVNPVGNDRLTDCVTHGMFLLMRC